MTRIVLIGVGAVVVRLALASTAPDAPLIADMSQYHERALYLRDHWAFGPDALRGPGYSAVLAVAYAALGESTNWAGRVANAVVGGLLVVTTGLLARALGAGRRAWIAAAIAACYPALLLSSFYQMPDTLYALWGTAFLLALHDRSLRGAAVAGTVAGLALLTRSVGLVLLPTAAVAWGLQVAWREAAWRQTAGRAALFAVCAAAVLLPWLTYTQRVTGRPVLDTTSGYNAVVGSNPRATGRLELRDGQWLVETYMLGASTIANAELQGMRAAGRWALDHPARWARLAVVKVAYLWGLEGREHSWVYALGYFGARSATAVTIWGWAMLAAFPVLVCAALAGACAAPGGWTPDRAAAVAMLVVTSVLHVLSFGESRFHLPLVPLLAAVASLGWPDWRRVPVGRAATAGAVLLALVWAWSWQLPELRHRLDTFRASGGAPSPIEY